MDAKTEFDQMCAAGEVAGPCSDQKIYDAEAELMVVFPVQYREFLSEYGAVVLDGVEIYGLPNVNDSEMPLWQDVVKVSRQLKEWQQAGSEVPAYVPIADDGTGVYFYLDTNAGPKTRIIAIGPGVEQVVSSDLFEFALSISNGELTV